MLSKEYKSTRELLGALMEGGEAVKRDNPRGNETSYFFMVPKAQSPTGEEVINVPDGVDPQAFKAAGYKVPETASTGTPNSGLSSMSTPTAGWGNSNSSTLGWGSSSSPASSWNGMSNPTAGWGNTNSSSSGWGSSTSGFGSTQNSGFGTQNPWGSNTGYGSTENTTPSFWGSTNSGLGSSSNSWGSNNGFGLNSSGNNSLSGSWNNGTNTLNNGLESTPSYMGSNPSTLANGIGSRDNTQNALNPGGDIPSLYGWNQYQDFLNKKRLEEIPKIRPVVDNSQYSLWRPIELLDTFKSGKYRTYASDVEPEWGDSSNNRIIEGIQDGDFSQEPANVFPYQTQIKKLYPILNRPEYEVIPHLVDFTESPIRYMAASLIAPVADFYKALKIRGSDIIGADKVAHCTANYNATKRGAWGEFVANKADAGKELWDSFIKGINVQDSNDDYAANKRGQDGAKKGYTVQDACPTHPRKYFIQD